MIDALPLLLGPEGYQISRSVRLRSSASAYFSRTPASAGNRKTFTMNYWLKRGELGTRQVLASAGTGASAGHAIELQADNTLTIYANNAGAAITLTTSQVFRDPSAYGMLTIAFDTTQATASNRVKLYWNGSQITAFSTATYPSQNADLEFNNNVPQNIGRREIGTTFYFDGYLTEINFIDGLTPNTTTRTVGGVTQTVLTELGEFDAVTGVWKPARWTRSFGTNGFYLNFSDPSAATAAAIGADRSGNGNNWTPNNISVTAGVTYDSMLDVPTPWPDGGNGRGNYATLNPLKGFGGLNSSGNLNITNGTSAFVTTIAAPQSGKWYFEFSTPGNTASTACGVFARPMDSVLSAIGDVNTASTTYYRNDGALIENGSTVATYTAWSTGANVIGVALDMDAKTIRYYLNNTAQGASARNLLSTTSDYTVAIFNYISGQTLSCNFGQRPFSYTPPSGFNALNTQNLPTPTIAKGNQFFDATLYTGNGSTQSIVNSGGMQPDMVWIKSRSNAFNHWLSDSVRGVSNFLSPSQTVAEATYSTLISAYNSNGFTLGNDAGGNTNAATYVGWQWKEGATQGFDIVTYTGDGVGGRAVSHSLGVAPAMIMIKARSHTTNWMVWHQNLAANFAFEGLNTTGAAVSGGSPSKYVRSVSSSTFTIGNDISVNQSASYTYVAYLFAEVAGFSRFGSYTGNGSTDGPFVFCGFRPRFVMVKRTDTTASWYVHDTARSAFNAMDNVLYPNLSNQEGLWSTSALQGVDALSNGFKWRNNFADVNASGGTYIYAAFAEVPFRYALAR